MSRSLISLHVVYLCLFVCYICVFDSSCIRFHWNVKLIYLIAQNVEFSSIRLHDVFKCIKNHRLAPNNAMIWELHQLMSTHPNRQNWIIFQFLLANGLSKTYIDCSTWNDLKVKKDSNISWCNFRDNSLKTSITHLSAPKPPKVMLINKAVDHL